MTLGRKTSATAKALQDVLGRRERAEGDAAAAADAFAAVEADTEAKLATLALSDATPEQYAQGKAEAVAVRQAAAAERERCDAILRALSERADELAVQVEQERVAAGEQEVARLASEREQAAGVLAEVSARHDVAEDELERARLAVERAARYTAENAARAEALAEQEREVVEWHSQHFPLNAERWPAHLRDAIRADVERRRAEHEAGRQRQADESRENLRRVGLTPETAREALGVGESRPWRRL